MENYVYKPKQFYFIVFVSTWLCWLLAFFSKTNELFYSFMFLGLIAPTITSLVTIFTSKNKLLKKDFKRKIIGFYKVKPFNILLSIIVYATIIGLSIMTNILLFNGSYNQFSFNEDFSFSIGGTSALLTIFLASVIEEIAWRGYGEDSIGAYFNWFKESIIFGTIWSIWHIPLFWLPGTYHFELKEMGLLYMINFVISVIPLNFLQTWVYLKNNRSMFATIIFHIFVNIMQEKIAMTPETKCIQTIFIIIFAIIIIFTNKQIFFDTKHIGKLLEIQNMEK